VPPESTTAKQILGSLPELPAPEKQLQIEPLAEEGRITSLSTPEPSAIELLPSPVIQDLVPTTTEITLPDAPIELPIAGNFPQVVSAPISHELELPHQPLAVEPSTVSRELELTDQPVEPVNSDLALEDAPPINSSHRLPLEVPLDLYDFERNHWPEPSNEPELVHRFENLLVEEEPNQWNTERTRTKPYSSATSSPTSHPSMAEAGPSNYGRRQGRAQPARPADTEENNPSQFFKPSTHFTMRDGSQYLLR
jgi:hypothetical protein